ncbi:homocysteine S-methyltransferase [Sinosporangium siamense]|uniref:S-methylmethionine:homocysteine methyltransferase n=1 Tax=Sinosporangium siamense TaxID=1367973 RepID=A0A919RAA0_9ACTN|nr:homocysteine S-methyltransferase [Sinosporangium siamense]
MATRLEALGNDLRDDLWSARLLADDPEVILRAHRDYFTAGADVATTASYQATIPGLMRRGCSAAEAERLISLSVEIAGRARDEHGSGLVAASVGPYGAYLANGAEYTGDYDLDEDGLTDWHRDRWHLLAGTDADLLACETIPSYGEAQALARLLDETPDVRIWVSFSCRDEAHISDGTPLKDAAAVFSGHPRVVAVGINCTQPRYIPSLIRCVDNFPVVVYPNSGEDYDPVAGTWTGFTEPDEFAQAAVAWFAAGASLIGGCCRTTPEHIRGVRARLS